MDNIPKKDQKNELVNWLLQGKFYLFSCIIVIITFLYLINILNYFPNIVSAILSILGLGIILIPLNRDAEQFMIHNPRTIANWIKSFPRRKHYVLNAGTGNFTLDGVSVRARGTVSDNSSLENKVEFLLRHVANLENGLDDMGDRIEEVKKSVTDQSKQFNTELLQQKKLLETIIASHIVGDYDVTLSGVIIAICGLFIQVFRG